MAHKIQWTDYTWNPIWGCNGGCEWCYARRIANRFSSTMTMFEHKELSAQGFPDVSLEKLQKDLKSFKPTFLLNQFNKFLPKSPKKIFMGSMTDIAFWEESWQICVLIKMSEHPEHIFQILTKFPERITDIEFPDNVWIGTTVEDQEKANKRIPELLKIKAGKRFVSIEPMQGAIDLNSIEQKSGDKHICYYQVLKPITTGGDSNRPALDWVIAGGQTGPRAVPMYPQWVRNIKNQCKEASVPFFFKSWGSWLPWELDAQPPFGNSQNGQTIDTHGLEIIDPESGEHNKKWYDTFDLGDNMLGFEKVGSKNTGHLLDGEVYQEFPE